MRYRLESRPLEGYQARCFGSEGWTPRPEFGVFTSLDNAHGVAFAEQRREGVIFAVVPVDEEEGHVGSL